MLVLPSTVGRSEHFASLLICFSTTHSAFMGVTTVVEIIMGSD
jgi:hypothetical protein